MAHSAALPGTPDHFNTIDIKLNKVFKNKNNFNSIQEKKEKEKMFIKMKNICYYNVCIHKLKLAIKYFNLNITVTSHVEKVSMFISQISDTRLSLL